MKRFSSVFLCCLAALGSGLSALASPAVISLPALSDATSWDVQAPSPGFRFDTVDGLLGIHFDGEPGTGVSLMLKQPVEVPGEANEFTFTCFSDPAPTQVRLFVILEAAGGERWFADTKLPGANAYTKSLNVINPAMLKGAPVRVTVPAMMQPENQQFRSLDAPGLKLPARPWKIVGLLWKGDRQPNHAKQECGFYLGNFALDDLRVEDSAYAGLFRNQEFFVELDGKPGIPVADYYSSPGSYDLSWSVYDDYAGKPVLSGTDRVEINTGPAAPALALQLSHRTLLPELAAGTHWVRWRARKLHAGQAVPVADSVVEQEARLYVATVHDPVQASQTGEASSALLDIVPTGKRFVAEKGDPFGVNIICRKPSAYSGTGTLSVTVSTPNLGTKLKHQEFPVAWGDASEKTIPIDLGDLPEGACRVQAELKVPEGLLDRSTVLTGRAGVPPVEKPLDALPPGVADWKTTYARNEPFFPLSPMIHSRAGLVKDKNRWDWFSNFLDQAPTVSKEVEYCNQRSLLEPLPGVFDWEELDLFLSRAARRGLQVLVWYNFWGQEPEWLPTVPAESDEGRIYYDFAYNFHGARENYSQSPVLRGDVESSLAALVGHVRSSPQVQGYFLIQELPADADFMNWREGFDPLTIQNYRAFLKSRFPGNELDARWGRPVGPVDDLLSPEKSASARERLDWLLFRADSADAVMQDLVQTVRKLDELRPIITYSDIFGTRLTFDWLRDAGCATANGGSHDAMHPFSISQIGFDGLVQRTEDHLPGKWTGYFPTVLDASVFSMSYGGGKAMNCKAYTFTYIPGSDHLLKFDDLRQPPYSLDRYEKFMPIWRAMRPCERMPVEAVELLDTGAGLLTNGFLSMNGLWDGGAELACYHSHINFSADCLPSAAKAKLLFAIKDHLGALTRESIDQLTDYVKNGGHLLLVAPTGRKCVEDPGTDWALLKAFGFSHPSDSATEQPSMPVRITNAAGFDSSLTPFALSGRWVHSASPDEKVVAAFQDGTPALSWKPFGQGAVAVLWGSGVTPRGDGVTGPPGGNVLGAAARWAGIEPVMGASTPLFWLNLLRNSSGSEYFGLVHEGQWAGNPFAPVAGEVRFRLDDDAKYRVVEMISGRDLGIHDGRSIWQTGLHIGLTPRDVAILHFTRQ